MSKLVLEKDFHGNTLSIETGRVAKQAGGSVLVSYGDSIVLVTACMGDERDVGFLPLSVDYVEKTYAAGRIPGGYLKREGRLGEKEILSSRIIDRPCRPLFPKGLARELQVVATVLSCDRENDTDVLALCGASAALTISDIPFEGPVAAVRVGRKNGDLVINPTQSELEGLELNFLVAGTKDAIVMVEGGSEEVPEDEVLEALFFAHQEMQAIIEMQEEMQSKVGKPKVEFVPKARDEGIQAKVNELGTEKLKEAIRVEEKHARKVAVKAVRDEIIEHLVPEDDEDGDEKTAEIKSSFEDLVYETVRAFAFKDSVRIDGRDFDTVRGIDIEVGMLPRTHGSALFTRGETQAIVTATLGTESEAQRYDSLMETDARKRFMLHYNFPPFCVGEVKMLRGASRREIGHGALAERAVRGLIPESKDFPYTVRVVSEVTESNGSSSMASVCGASLALMDAGVPIKAPVAGVAMGLLAQDDQFVVLTDILGDEDHLGDMDFKVCGTEKGITALQMDIKIKGLKKEIMAKALEQAKAGRLHILQKMNEVISEARGELSPHAPRIITIKINPDKIRDVIGQGGKTIRSLQETYSVKIDIDDSGLVQIASLGEGVQAEQAREVIESLTAEAEVGKLYKGVVKRISDFGAFVEIIPGTDGLLHISELKEEKVRRVSDVVNVGEEVWVKVLDVDRFGKIRLSRRAALEEMGAEEA